MTDMTIEELKAQLSFEIGLKLSGAAYSNSIIAAIKAELQVREEA